MREALGRTRGKVLALGAFLSIAVPGVAIACDLQGYYGAPGSEGVSPQGPGLQALPPLGCPGVVDPSFVPLTTVTGEFGGEHEGSYVMVPFDVPAGTTAIRVRYCYDQPDLKPPGSPVGNTLDLGLYEARSGPADLWDEDEFRGWGGSSHPDVTVSPNGFSPEATYKANPRQHVHGHTTRGFVPGAIPPGAWAVELGVAAVTPQSQGDSDGKIAWRVEIETSTSADWSNQPYRPAPYDSTPARSDPGWYAGDLHVHGEHSSLGDATMREVFDFAFRPIAQGGAGLDFLTLSDYVTTTGWGEIGRFQADYPGKLITRSGEVITYRGHTSHHGAATFADYRTGPILERRGDGSLEQVRGPRPASRIFDTVHAAGGLTQINHPTIFPSEVPGFDSFCRGCPWDYDNAETDYSKVDAIEIATGPAGLKQDPEPGPNPFTPLALQFYEDALETGARIAAVGVSDSHNAGRTAGGTSEVTQSPIGQATTVVFAPRLSEEGIEAGVEARHTYVKIFGNDGPDLRFTGRRRGADEPEAIMGDELRADRAEFTARVLGAGTSAPRPGPHILLIYRSGVPVLSVPITEDDFRFPFEDLGRGRYRLQVQRLGGIGAIEAASSPIWLVPRTPGGGGGKRPKGRCSNPVLGTPKRDRLRGTRGGDLIAAVGGRDRLWGFAGRDCAFAGPGRDVIRDGKGADRVQGGGGRDTLRGGGGRDVLMGGKGPDRIIAVGRGRDRVRCGPGRDRAVVGRGDRVRRCERVVRRPRRP